MEQRIILLLAGLSEVVIQLSHVENSLARNLMLK